MSVCFRLTGHFSLSVSIPTVKATSHNSSALPSPSAPCCSAHHRPAALRVVHKDGENKGRQFYTCSLPRETKCNFFEVKNGKQLISMALCSSEYKLQQYVWSLLSMSDVSLQLVNKEIFLFCFFALLQWADSHFPFCHHGKHSLMRTVLKLGPNNGRNFYTCSLIKGKQCGFFQWAENGPGC